MSLTFELETYFPCLFLAHFVSFYMSRRLQQKKTTIDTKFLFRQFSANQYGQRMKVITSLLVLSCPVVIPDLKRIYVCVLFVLLIFLGFILHGCILLSNKIQKKNNNRHHKYENGKLPSRLLITTSSIVFLQFN